MKSDRFGEKARALMRRHGITQQEMAARINAMKLANDPRAKETTQQSVGNWIKKSKVPNVSILFPMARILGVTVDYLIDDAMDEPVAAGESVLPEDERKVLWIYRSLDIKPEELLRRIKTIVVTRPEDAVQAPAEAEGGGAEPPAKAESPAKATDTGTIVNKRTVKGETVPEKGKGNPGGSDLDPKPEDVPGDGGAGVRPVPRRRR